MPAYEKFNWSSNPFTLKIDPKLFTGYEEPVKAILSHIENKHKIALVTGSTGAGKTVFLRWLDIQLDSVSSLYISKPPKNPEEFVTIFTDIFGLSFFDRVFNRKPSLYTLPRYINSKIGSGHLLFLIDEAHETNQDVMEWLRVLTDQIDNVTLILAGLPVLEEKIRSELETLNQRITTRIKLTALSENETKELIRKRITNVGGLDTKPFNDSAIAAIYHRTGGFPREVLKFCDKLINTAFEKDKDTVEGEDIKDFREFKEEKVRLEEPVVAFSPRPPTEEQIQNLPFRQKQLLEALSKTDWLTPSALADQIGIEKYKTRSHAIRSINNILHRLMLDGFVQREAHGKAFMYSLSPKTRTIFVTE